MGGFSNFRSFLSNHILPNQSQSQGQSLNQQKQQKASLDDRSLHSFNPHYQHNLHSTSYSTPPSLASSPTNSSPTSTTSASSNSSCNKSRYSYSTVGYSKGVKSPPQHQPQYFPRRSYYHQQQIQQQLLQQQQNSRQHSQHRSANGHQYQQNRRSYQRNHNQYHNQAYLEDELSLGSSSTATAMDLASPVDPSPLSVAMWQGQGRRQRQQQQQQQQQQSRTSHILVSRASESEKHASQASSKRSPSSSRPQWSTPTNPTKRHSSALEQQQYQYLSSSPFTISESRASTAVSYMQDADVSEDVTEMPSSTVSSSSSSCADKMDAKTSLMRIAQCGRHEDSWCALQSGQYARHYAESRSGVTVDGRRARRM
ncbi:hypothetical protein MVEG_04838 [Podila verticillata NRRL 6337]|nr:MAG: hypothetical protein BYD32DRAFT_432556 [Podila humilis]KFH70035.1 hypothetical protein MVEG_04838 [Podila verticillata NRRL 6337]